MNRQPIPIPIPITILLLCVVGIAPAQVRPNGHWRQIESNHFRIIYEAGLDSLAQHAVQRAELEHARLNAALVRAPSHKIDIIIADNTDITNGYASPFPNSRIVLYARPPVDELSLQYYDDWLDLVITHELTHVFHFERAGRVGRALRGMFGRVPVSWPFFPVLDMPRWNLEGLATLIESEHTGAGRLHGSYHEMVVRTDVLEKQFPPIDRVSGETPIWPGGERAYIYGSLFMEYVARTYGEAAHRELVGKTKGSVLPASWRMDGIAKQAVGKSYSDMYREWHAALARSYAALADTLRARGLSAPETLTAAGRHAWYPRVAPDNRRVAYADGNGREVTATRVIDVATRSAQRIRRNGYGPVTWLPDGSGYITAQYELTNPYDGYSDLYLVTAGREQRLTHRERAETPDLTRDGRLLVYVQNVNGSNRLMLRDMTSGSARVLVERSPDVQWTLPRWSPQGDRVAVQQWSRARGHDIVVLDRAGRELQRMATTGTDGAPAWSPDGRVVLFSSDRTGITNLYAGDSTGIRQVTNVLGGAFYPDVSADGRWLYYSAYHADGFHIERIAYDPSAWREPAPARRANAMRPDTIQPAPARYENLGVSQPAQYRALRSVLPTWWTPVFWGDSALGTFVGAATSGWDDVQRHSYFASLAVDVEHGRTAGALSYSYAGLGNPVLNLELLRDWDDVGRVIEREDRATLSAALSRRRWRSAGALLLGVEAVGFNRSVIGPGTLRDARDRLFGVVGGVSFGNSRLPALAISREDGVRLNAFVRRRFDADPSAVFDASYTEYQGATSAYQSVGWFGFAHHVLAVRASALVRTGTGVGPTNVGSVVDYLPVRGFGKNSRIGFAGWSASAEYRVPIALVGRGYQLRPFFLDRVAGSLFVDAGNASCTAGQRQSYNICAGAAGRPRELLLSTGLEVNATAALLSFMPFWARGGVAFPLQGGRRRPQVYLTLGPAF